MLASAVESCASFVAKNDDVVPPAAAIASVFAWLPPAKLMTYVLILNVLPPTVTPVLKSTEAALTASACVSHVSSPSVSRMTLTERHGRSLALSGVG